LKLKSSSEKTEIKKAKWAKAEMLVTVRIYAGFFTEKEFSERL